MRKNNVSSNNVSSSPFMKKKVEENTDKRKSNPSPFLKKTSSLFCTKTKALEGFFSPKTKKRKPLCVLGGVLALFCLVFLAWYEFAEVDFTQKSRAYIDVVIPSGASAVQVRELTKKNGIEVSDTFFSVGMRLLGNAKGIHSGRYRFPAGVTHADIVYTYSHGEVAQGTLRIQEGMSFKDLKALVEANEDLDQTAKTMTNEELLRAIGAEEKHPEGLFAPDTYKFNPGVSSLTVYKKAYERQKAILSKYWNARAPRLKLKNAYEALILASIIEKETGIHTDRYLVSSVFHNRLRIWMPLQTDPTVIYAMGDDYKGKIHKRDLQRKSPYNTYVNYGLPPTPIAMPSRASIEAALRPANSKYLYFVASGDGTTKFSTALVDHNDAVDVYQRGKKAK